MAIPIGCAQMACSPFDPRFNLDKAEHFVHEAAVRGARLVVLPELLTTGCTYDRRLHEFAEPVGGATTRWLQSLGRRTCCWIGAGIVEKAGNKIFDTFLLAGPKGEILSYRKQYPAFFEHLYFDRGQTLGIFDTALGRIGVMICWDMVHARLSRAMAGRIDLLLIGSAWPDVDQGNFPLFGIQGWLSRQPAQRPPLLAKTLGVPVVYCNMTGDFVTRIPWLGVTYRSVYAGRSSITDEQGKTTAVEREETILMADVQIDKPRVQPRAA